MASAVGHQIPSPPPAPSPSPSSKVRFCAHVKLLLIPYQVEPSSSTTPLPPRQQERSPRPVSRFCSSTTHSCTNRIESFFSGCRKAPVSVLVELLPASTSLRCCCPLPSFHTRRLLLRLQHYGYRGGGSDDGACRQKLYASLERMEKWSCPGGSAGLGEFLLVSVCTMMYHGNGAMSEM
ncbi:uncharacterized protein [Lolium perenne]|uniref:uncharacterized protein isoform X1 n=1 Tax=Lolium perenne TaxID=4522 RepID=UPI003A9A3504